MGILVSELKTTTAEFRARATEYAQAAEELRALIRHTQTITKGDAEQLRAKRNKLAVQERIARLIDPGTAQLDLAPLAGLNVDGSTEPGAGIHLCVGQVSGRTCMIIANNPEAKGGTYLPMTVKKHLRGQEIAAENRLPCIYLVDSGGAFLPLQDRVFPDREHFGRIFFNQARMSAAGIPQLSVVLGSCTAGGAYVPAMSDEAIMVRGNASIFLGGPPLVKAATGEEVTAEELGGADVHCSTSGVADHLAESELEALDRAREIVASYGRDRAPRFEQDASPEPPRYDPRELYGIMGMDLRRTAPVREVLARVLDGSRFDEFKASFGTTLRCGFGHIYGYRVGIIANDGILFSESALKAAHFIELCNQRLTPILFIQNIVGFMVGKRYEHEGIAKHGAKMVAAVATSRVPKYTLVIGGSFGAGNYGMCGRAYDPRFLFTWPNSRTAVMGGQQAAEVLTEVKRAGYLRKGGTVPEQELQQYHAEITKKYETESHAFYGSARLWDDGVIDPLDTRPQLALAFASSLLDADLPYQPSVFRM